MIYVSYYTPNSYEKVFKDKLYPSLIKWKLTYDVEVLKDKGSWQENTHYKAKFCKKMLLKHKQSIAFCDVDATIEEYPLVFDFLNRIKKPDIALHQLDWYLLWRKQKGNPKREALSGTLYLNYNKKILNFVDEWIKENETNVQWEQRNLQKILEKWENKLQIAKLPIEYIAIIKFDGKVPNYIKEPVIIHHQASRKFKRQI